MNISLEITLEYSGNIDQPYGTQSGFVRVIQRSKFLCAKLHEWFIDDGTRLILKLFHQLIVLRLIIQQFFSKASSSKHSVFYDYQGLQIK